MTKEPFVICGEIERLPPTTNIEMSAKELHDHINRRLRVAEYMLANAIGYSEFKQREVLTKKLRNVLALLKRGDIDAAWGLLETSE